MANTVPESFVKAYHANISVRYFENGGKLAGIPGEIHDGLMAETDHYELVKQVEAAEKTTQFEEQPNLNPEHFKRSVNLRDFYFNAYIDKQDRLRLLADPQSVYVMNALEALRRKGDSLRYLALRGSAMQGKVTPTGIPLPSTQKIAVGTGPLSVEKIMDSAALLNKNNVPMDNRYLIVNWAGLDDMLREVEIGSVDYNEIKSLMTGQIRFWMGYTWILYNYAIEAGTYFAVACHPSALGESRAQDVFTSVDILPTKHFLTQVYASFNMASIRKQEEGVVEIAHTHA